MAVYYRVVTNSGRAYVRYVCFGLLNRVPDLAEGRDAQQPRDVQEASRRLLQNITPRDIKYLEYDVTKTFNWNSWSHPQLQPTRDAVTIAGESEKDFQHRCLNNYFKVVKEVIDDLPMYKGFITFHQEQNVIRFHVKDQPSDKLMTAMFLLRNLNQTGSAIYLFAREMGYRPRVCAAIYGLYYMNLPTPFQRGSISMNCYGESSIFDPNTFGKQGLINFLRQDESYSPWVQPNFDTTQRGYVRDSRMSTMDEYIFDAGLHQRSGLRYRKMITCFSVQNDSSIDDGYQIVIPPSRYNEYGGEPATSHHLRVDYDRQTRSGSVSDLQEVLRGIFDPIVAEAGI